MAKHATLVVTAEGDYLIWRPLFAHGTVVTEVLGSFLQERKDAAGPFAFGKLVCVLRL